MFSSKNLNFRCILFLQKFFKEAGLNAGLNSWENLFIFGRFIDVEQLFLNFESILFRNLAKGWRYYENVICVNANVTCPEYRFKVGWDCPS